MTHTDYYDEKNYSRDTDNMTTSTYGGGMNVFLGEYAAQSNTWKAALSEAAYMTGLERNGDIVKMAAYAPLFGNLTALHWSPDLIWFYNNTVTSSVNYYVQKIFAKNAGTTLLKSDMTGATVTSKPFGGKVGVGTWNTAAKFDNVKVVSKDTGKILGKETFTKAANFSKYWEQATDGVWSVKNGKLVQSSDVTNTITYGNQGSVAYFGNGSWKNYTYTVEATKISGQEGFMIPFSVGDKNENYFWNIGGWNNTVSCLQKVSGGSKSGQLAGTVTSCTIADDVKYNIKIEVKDRTESMKSIEYFWGMGYITVVLFAILQNGAFQHDFIDFFMAPFMWYVRFCKWLVYPTYDNGFNQKVAYTGGEVWGIRILAIVAVLFIVGILMVIIMETIKQYKKMWNEISQMFLIGSLSGIAVLGDVIRGYLPVNLILLFVFINVGIMLLIMYLRKSLITYSLTY